METQATFIQTKTLEEYTISWSIPNFLIVLLSPELFIFQTIKFELGPPGSIQSKWEARFAPSSSQTLVMCLRMLEQNHLVDVFSVRGKLECISAGKSEVLQHVGMFESNVPFRTRENQVFGTNLPQSPHHAIWRSLNVMPGGPLNLRITLTIYFPGITPVDSSKTTENKFAKSSMANLQKCFLKLRENAELADLKIVCSDGKEFAAHQLVLRARNPVFDAMLGTEMMEGTSGVVKVDDITGATMSILLHFFYTSELIDGWQKPEVVHEFVYAAGKYQLEEVLEMLDAVLGTEKVATCDVRLLSLANKLELKNADARIATRLGKLFSQVKTGNEMMKLLAN